MVAADLDRLQPLLVLKSETIREYASSLTFWRHAAFVMSSVAAAAAKSGAPLLKLK